MKQSIAHKLTYLNNAVVESLNVRSQRLIVKKFVDAGIKVFGADYGYCYWTGKKEDFKLVYKSRSTPYQPKIPRKKGIVVKAFRSNKPQLIEDVTNTPGVRYDAKAHMRGAVVIPLTHKRKTYGALVICFKDVKKFNEEDTSLTFFIGNAAAQAITIHRLYRDLQGFKNTLDSTLDSIIMFDANNFRITYVNQGSMEELGYKENELKNSQLTSLLPVKDRITFLNNISELQERPKKAKIFESNFLTKDNRKLTAEVFMQYIGSNTVGTSEKGQFLVIARDIEERKKVERAMKRSAQIDSLTKIPNRAYFMEKLEELIPEAAWEGSQFGVVFIDIDRFKFINDILGHSAGDQLLKETAKRLRSSVKSIDMVARMGGDEFIVLLNKLPSPDTAVQTVKRLQQVFEKPFHLSNQEVYVNASFGISTYPTDGEDAHTLLRNSDFALLRTKDEGGGGFKQYHVSIPSALRKVSLDLDTQIRRALKDNQFVPFYHPQIEIATGKVKGYEALVRWNHPELGILTPEKFVGQAEETGLISELDKQVISEVLASHALIAEELGELPKASVNLSMRTLLQPGLVEFVNESLIISGVPSGCLKLELTETMVMKNVEFSMSVLQNFKNMGVGCHMDDFGTGYTSIASLKRLPIEAVKIDRSFIKGIGVDPHDEVIIAAIISLAHDLQLKVLAEGVETKHQLNFLSSKGCDFAQGNYFSIPLAEELFLNWLAEQHS